MGETSVGDVSFLQSQDISPAEAIWTQPGEFRFERGRGALRPLAGSASVSRYSANCQGKKDSKVRSIGGHAMKKLDVIAAVLLVVGGLNWGLVGLFNFDLVAALLGQSSFMSSLVYILVGLGAVYQGLMWKGIQRRWSDASA
jgi:uncharacterized membrane protein YuzA (DUF378 family)